MIYKYRFLYNFVYVWIFIFEISLMVVGYFATRYYYIFIPIVFLIFLLNIYAFIRQIQTSYVITENGLSKLHKGLEVELYRYEDIKMYKKLRLYIEFTVKLNKKIKTIYISKLLKNYKDLEKIFETNLKEVNKDVVFL